MVKLVGGSCALVAMSLFVFMFVAGELPKNPDWIYLACALGMGVVAMGASER
jgi:hypothetical protein